MTAEDIKAGGRPGGGAADGPGHGGLTRTSRGRGQVIELRAQAAP